MKELEDLNWFPAVFRNFQTSFIGFVVRQFGVYTPFVQYLKTRSLPVQPVTDLCSGSGEPAISIFRKSNCFSNLVLTDKYPGSPLLFSDNIFYETQQKDVLEIEFRQDTYYTMFNAFHHFSDTEKVHIVSNIKASGSVAFFVEILEPTLLCLVKVIMMTTIGCLLLTPFIHPFSLKRLFFTYILPVNLITITLDGVISVFKSRSLQQYQLLFAHENRSVKTLRLQNGLSSIIVIHIQPTL